MTSALDRWAAAAIEQLPAGVADRFASDPLTVLTELGLTVRPAEHLASRSDGGNCDGVSYLEDGLILYRPTGNRREFYTLAHELGHWLVDQLEGAYDWAATHDDSMKLIEAMCDRVAHQLLVPETLVRSVASSRPLRAAQVLELAGLTHASRPVCAIALAPHLPGTGAIVLIDRSEQVIRYASVQPEPDLGWPVAAPWPRDPVPAGHPLGSIHPGQGFTGKTYWQTRWGTRAQYYVDAVVDGMYTIAVFADHDLWSSERLHLEPHREYLQRPIGSVSCCGGEQVARGFPCETCGQHYCPRCKRCQCDRRAAREQECMRCHLQRQKHLLNKDGVCVDCLD